MIRTDLPIADQIVQACHASLDAGKKFGGNESTFLCLLAVKSQSELLCWQDRLEENGVKTTIFYEPDSIDDSEPMPMGFTSIATEPIPENDNRRRVLRKLQVWKS